MIIQRRIMTRVFTILPLIVCLLISCKKNVDKNPLTVLSHCKITKGNLLDVKEETRLTYKFEMVTEGHTLISYLPYIIRSKNDSITSVLKDDKNGAVIEYYFTNRNNSFYRDSFTISHPAFSPSATHFNGDAFLNAKDSLISCAPFPSVCKSGIITNIDSIERGVIKVKTQADSAVGKNVYYLHPDIGLIGGFEDTVTFKLVKVETAADTFSFSEKLLDKLKNL